MWVSNSGHGPGFYRRLSRLCAIQGTQVWGQTGTELLQSVWLAEGALFYQGRFFFFLILVCFGFFQGSSEGVFQTGVGPVWATEFPQIAFHREWGREEGEQGFPSVTHRQDG